MQLSPEDMEELVKEVLIAMGYIAERTPVGSDRDIDVFASKDGLGLEEPRIFVEVKHRDGKMGAAEIRKFLGGCKPHDKCVFISTDGFSQDARYEAERVTIPLTLVDIQRLSSIIERYYDNFSASGKILLPLYEFGPTQFHYNSLRRFFISLIWRVSICKRIDYSLGEYEPIALDILKYNIPDNKDLFFH